MPDAPNPYDFFNIPSQPSTTLFDQMAAATQAITQAQARYGQAMLRANMALFSAWFPQISASPDSEGPVKAARKSEFTQT